MKYFRSCDVCGKITTSGILATFAVDLGGYDHGFEVCKDCLWEELVYIEQQEVNIPAIDNSSETL